MRINRSNPKAALAKFTIAKRLVPFVLAAALLMSTAACSVASSAESTEVTSAIVGIAPTAEESDIAVADPLVNRYYEGKELECPEAGENVQLSCIDAVRTDNGFVILFSTTNIEDPMNPIYRSFIWIYDQSGKVVTKTDVFVKGTSPAGSGICLEEDPNGGFCGLFSTLTGKYVVLSFDERGSQVSDAIYLTTPPDYNYFESFLFTEDGTILAAGYSFIHEYSRDGELLRSIQSYDFQGQIFRVGDKVYAGCSIQREKIYSEYGAVEIPKEGTELGDEATYILPNYEISEIDGSIYGVNAEYLFEFNEESETIEPVLYWNRTDLVMGNNRTETLPIAEDQFLCMQTRYNINTLTLTLLTRQSEDYLSGKKVLTIAGSGISGNSAIERAVVDFNRESDEYRVEIVDYLIRYSEDVKTADTPGEYLAAEEAMQRQIKLEILSGNGPDMLLPSWNDDLSYYADSGILVDMAPYLAQDEMIDESLFVQSVWNASYEGDKIYELPLDFVLWGLYAPTQVVGNRTGWTFEEFNQVVSELPEGTRCFDVFEKQSSLLENALSYSMESFVNRENGEVNFDSEEFGALLDFVKIHGTPDSMFDEYGIPVNESLYSERSINELFASGAVLFLPYYGLQNPLDYAAVDNFCDDSGVSYCGYPSVTSAGPMAIVEDSIAIVDKGDVSEGCWQFVRTLLLETNQLRLTLDYEEDSFQYFPMLTSLLMEDIEMSKGEIDPLIQGYDYFDREYESLTDQQAEDLLSLISGVTVVDSENHEIVDIILEEAAPFFADQKSREEVMANIQNRVQTLVLEDM